MKKWLEDASLTSGSCFHAFSFFPCFLASIRLSLSFFLPSSSLPYFLPSTCLPPPFFLPFFFPSSLPPFAHPFPTLPSPLMFPLLLPLSLFPPFRFAPLSRSFLLLFPRCARFVYDMYNLERSDAASPYYWFSICSIQIGNHYRHAVFSVLTPFTRNRTKVEFAVAMFDTLPESLITCLTIPHGQLLI